MPTVHIYGRPVVLKASGDSGGMTLHQYDFDPIRGDDAGQEQHMSDGRVVELGPVHRFEVEVPEGGSIEDISPGYKRYRTADGDYLGPHDVMTRAIHGRDGFRLMIDWE